MSSVSRSYQKDGVHLPGFAAMAQRAALGRGGGSPGPQLSIIMELIRE